MLLFFNFSSNPGAKMNADSCESGSTALLIRTILFAIDLAVQTWWWSPVRRMPEGGCYPLPPCPARSPSPRDRSAAPASATPPLRHSSGTVPRFLASVGIVAEPKYLFLDPVPLFYYLAPASFPALYCHFKTVWRIQNVLMRIRFPLFKLMRIRSKNCLAREEKILSSKSWFFSSPWSYKTCHV